MAFRPGLPPIQLFPLRRTVSPPILLSSVAVHLVALAVGTWVIWQPVELRFHAAPIEVTRQYAMKYLVLLPVPPKRAAEPERRPRSRHGLVASMPFPEHLPESASSLDAGVQPKPARSSVVAMELPGDSIAGVGPGDVSGRAGVARGPDLFTRLGFRVPGAGGPTTGRDPRPGLALGDPEARGGTRIPELLSGPGTACPPLRRPPAWRERELTVSVAFVVDARGAVDPRTLRVVRSAERPQTDHRRYSHIYGVSSIAQVDDRLRDLTATYDSVVTGEVVKHVATLLFRPAMRDGRAVTSTVLVSCQSP